MPCDFLMTQAYDNIVLAKVMRERLLDAPAIASLSEDLMKLLDRYPRISLVLDLSDVGYLSSAMLGKLVALLKGVKAGKGRMAIAGVRPALKPLFTVTQLDKLMEFYPDAEQALLLYKRKPL